MPGDLRDDERQLGLLAQELAAQWTNGDNAKVLPRIMALPSAKAICLAALVTMRLQTHGYDYGAFVRALLREARDR